MSSSPTPRSAAHRVRFVVALAGLGALALAGCSTAAPEETAAAPATLTVFAAASLTETFTQLAEDFEAEHEGVTVQLSFDGSSSLVQQIVDGAPADVFASADLANMTKLVDADLAAGDPSVFATNTLQIVVPAGNPGGVTGLADLADPDLRIVVCAPEVPCGAALEKVEAATGVTVAPDSEEQAVTDVLGKVTSGEADAGVVYVTDVIRGGDAVEGIALDGADAAVNEYPITAVEGAGQPDLAAEFIAMVLGASGQQVLAEAGFGAP